jgi:hypothetical protein
MFVLKFSSVLIILLVFVSPFFVSAALAEASENEAASALVNADGVVVSAYQAVLKAEEEGANVSSLLVRLSEAGDNLAHGHMAYSLGDFDETTRSAGLSRNIGEEVRNEANELTGSARAEGAQRLWSTATGSVVGVIAVVFGSFLVWRVFKRRYYRQVLGMRPEVGADES